MSSTEWIVKSFIVKTWKPNVRLTTISIRTIGSPTEWIVKSFIVKTWKPNVRLTTISNKSGKLTMKLMTISNGQSEQYLQ